MSCTVCIYKKNYLDLFFCYIHFKYKNFISGDTDENQNRDDKQNPVQNDTKKQFINFGEEDEMVSFCFEFDIIQILPNI